MGSWLSEELVVFWASFFGAWFGSAGSEGNVIGGHGGEHFGDESVLAARGGRGGMDGGGKVPGRVQRAFEAEALERGVIEVKWGQPFNIDI